MNGNMDRLVALANQLIENSRFASQVWLVRSEGGRLYDDFRNSGYVSMGYPDVPIVKNPSLYNSKSTIQDVRFHVLKAYPKFDKRTVGRISSEIHKFEFGLKEGDFVLTPSTDSTRFAIGKITKDLPISVVNKAKHRRGREVEWIAELLRSECDLELQSLFRTRRTIVDAKPYSRFLYKKISDFYSVDGIPFFSLRITSNGDVCADDFYQTAEIRKVIREISKMVGFDFDSRALTIKTKVQSPGDILFSLKDSSQKGLLAFALVAMLLGCGETQINDMNASADQINDIALSVNNNLVEPVSSIKDSIGRMGEDSYVYDTD